MERLEHLVEQFRKDRPELDADILLEFAQHLQRVLIDELREDTRAGNMPVSMSMQINGASFSAKGPRWYVEDMLARWQDAAARKSLPSGFNRMKLISGR